MKLLGELKAGDTFYLINNDGGFNEWIFSVEKCIVKDILEIKIGRIVHYTKVDDEYKDVHGFTLQYNEYESETCTAYCETIVCADKEYMLEILEAEKDNFKESINNMINQIK